MLCDVLKDQKVETKGIRFDSQARTALAFVTLRDDGEREFMFYRNPSADMLFQINELDIDLLKEVLLCVLWLISTTLLDSFHFRGSTYQTTAEIDERKILMFMRSRPSYIMAPSA